MIGSIIMGFPIIVSMIVGIVVGLIPAICGVIKQKMGFAIGGFFACVAASLLLGLLLAVPVCAVFVFLIFRNK